MENQIHHPVQEMLQQSLQRKPHNGCWTKEMGEKTNQTRIWTIFVEIVVIEYMFIIAIHNYELYPLPELSPSSSEEENSP